MPVRKAAKYVLFGTLNRANRGYSRTHSSPPLTLCLDASRSVLPSLSLSLQSNIELILCLFLGAKARGGCVIVYVSVCVCQLRLPLCLDGCFILALVAIATQWDFQCV